MTGPPATPGLQSVSAGPRLLDRVKAAIQMRHMSARTEEAYVGWIRRFIYTHVVNRGPLGVQSPLDRPP